MTTSDGPRFRRYTSGARAAMLVEAGLACLARGGITDFTIDNICRESGASRGLITHHFGSKDGLLAAIYATMYDRLMAAISLPDDGDGDPDLVRLVEASLAPEVFRRDSLKIWLALWGEIANSPKLQEAHRRRYTGFRETVARSISHEAERRGKTVDAQSLATMFIALSDGVWLEHAIDPDMLTADAARQACYGLLEAALGPLERSALS